MQEKYVSQQNAQIKISVVGHSCGFHL